jgi:hypothetical protein
VKSRVGLTGEKVFRSGGSEKGKERHWGYDCLAFGTARLQSTSMYRESRDNQIMLGTFTSRWNEILTAEI